MHNAMEEKLGGFFRFIDKIKNHTFVQSQEIGQRRYALETHQTSEELRQQDRLLQKITNPDAVEIQVEHNAVMADEYLPQDLQYEKLRKFFAEQIQGKSLKMIEEQQRIQQLIEQNKKEQQISRGNPEDAIRNRIYYDAIAEKNMEKESINQFFNPNFHQKVLEKNLDIEEKLGIKLNQSDYCNGLEQKFNQIEAINDYNHQYGSKIRLPHKIQTKLAQPQPSDQQQQSEDRELLQQIKNSRSLRDQRREAQKRIKQMDDKFTVFTSHQKRYMVIQPFKVDVLHFQREQLRYLEACKKQENQLTKIKEPPEKNSARKKSYELLHDKEKKSSGAGSNLQTSSNQRSHQESQMSEQVQQNSKNLIAKAIEEQLTIQKKISLNKSTSTQNFFQYAQAKNMLLNNTTTCSFCDAAASTVTSFYSTKVNQSNMFRAVINKMNQQIDSSKKNLRKIPTLPHTSSHNAFHDPVQFDIDMFSTQNKFSRGKPDQSHIKQIKTSLQQLRNQTNRAQLNTASTNMQTPPQAKPDAEHYAHYYTGSSSRNNPSLLTNANKILISQSKSQTSWHKLAPAQYPSASLNSRINTQPSHHDPYKTSAKPYILTSSEGPDQPSTNF